MGNGFVGLDQMSDAAAHATITLAQSSEMLNGERGKGNFKPRDAEPLPAVAGREHSARPSGRGPPPGPAPPGAPP